jgi:hypothetical protein
MYVRPEPCDAAPGESLGFAIFVQSLFSILTGFFNKKQC